MAGCFNLEDDSCIRQCNETLKRQELKLQNYFIKLVSRLLKRNSGNGCFKPLPPRLGNGDCIDLLKLYFVVKQKGGFESISENNLWGEVSLQCGLESGFGSAFKLIYAKYLGSLESWLLESNSLMEIEKLYRAYMTRIMDVNRGGDSSCSSKLDKSGISFIDLTDDDDENERGKLGWKKLVMDFADSEGSNEGNDESNVKSKELKNGMSFADAGDSTEGNDEYVDSKQHVIVNDSFNDDCIIVEDNGEENFKNAKSEMSSVDDISSNLSVNKRFSGSRVLADDVSVASKKYSTKYNEQTINVDSAVSKEVFSFKRKRDSTTEMLEWMANVAKDPTDSVIGEIPGKSKWASFGNDNIWKQALLARQAVFLKKIRSRNTEQFSSLKKAKMHPSLFDNCENFSRPSQRLEARLDMQPNSSIYTGRPQQRIPIGKDFQAEVPEWTGVAIESDPKWLGTRTWPLEKSENHDPLGKGRTDNCSCQFPGSTECIKSHVSEKRMKTRFDLGSAFYAWNFDKMGEDCSVSWTIEEEKKFRSIVKENPQSSQKCFWEPMCKALPKKKWPDQVNYYYNVFMLRRRGYQNRHYPSDIDSGDDETEYRSTNNSIRHGSA